MDPDEYRLMHPFNGVKSDAKNLADRLNSWEKGNDFVYKLEADKLKSVTDEAIKNQTLIVKNGNSTTTIVISVQNQNTTLQANVSNSTTTNNTQLQQKNQTITINANQTSNAT